MAEYYILDINIEEKTPEAKKKKLIWIRANSWAATLLRQKLRRGINVDRIKKPYITVEEDDNGYYLIIDYRTIEADKNYTRRKITCEFDPFQDTIRVIKDVDSLEELANQQP